MDRITPKEVLSMIDAVAQVYEQPEVEQVDEVFRNLRPGESVKQYEERKRKEAEDAARNQYKKDNPTPNYASMSDDEFAALVKKSGNPEGLMAKRKNQQAAAAKNTVPAGSFNISPKGSDRRNEVEAQIKKDNAARTDDQSVEPKTAPKPALTDQQKVRAEYDRLRYSKDPKERAQAAGYGKAMASAGAAKKDFSGYKSAAELSKPAGNIVKSGSGATLSSAPKNDLAKGSTPIVVNRGTTEKTSYAYDKPVTGSMAQRLQAIRARSQSRIAAQGGTSATPAVNPTSKSAPPPVSNTQTKPAVTPNQQSSLNKTVQSGSSQIPTGDTIKTKVNPDSSLSVTQKRSPEATKKIKQSLELQSADLFDIVKGEFINEGYSEEDTMYMMANLNEEQLQEFMKYVQGAINVGKRIPGVRGVINRVGAMFNRAPKQMPSGQVGALRLYQDKANQSLNRLNQQTTRLDKRAATRAAQREADRLNNLDPRAVSKRNAREAAAQVRARNERLGRPVDAAPQPVDKLNYKPGDPMFDDYVKRHHANQRGGVLGYTNTGVRRINK